MALGVVSIDGLEVLGERRMPGRAASERLLGEVRRCYEAVGWRVGETEAAVVVHGPGSFTGVRVGVSAAKGLSEGTGAGLVAMSRLEVLAGCAEIGGGRVRAVLDAGRGEMYCGVYEDGVRVQEVLLTAEEVVGAQVGGEVVVACEAGVMERLAGLRGLVLVSAPGALEALWMAAGRVWRREFVDASAVDGFYLRRTEAEMLARLAAHAAAAAR